MGVEPVRESLIRANNNRRKGILSKLREQRQLLYMSVPFMLVLVVFSFFPLWGWIMAFQNYTISKGVSGSPFVGLKNFHYLFRDPEFFRVLRNTLVMSGLNMIVGFIGAIVFALLLNEIRSSVFKRTIQTVTYIPHFASWVVIANIVIMGLSPDGGMVNEFLVKLGILREPYYFLSKGQWFWLIHTAANFWKELGWSTIVYLAVLSGINPELYEAGEVDGAGRFRKMWNISIPGMMPTAIILLIISVGYLVQSGYESQFLLGNPMVQDYSNVLDLYALNYSFRIGQYSLGVAISIFKSVISIILVLSVNALAKRFTDMKLI